MVDPVINRAMRVGILEENIYASAAEDGVSQRVVLSAFTVLRCISSIICLLPFCEKMLIFVKC